MHFLHSADPICTDPTKVKLLRYEDVQVGPRRIPNIDNIMSGKVEIKVDARFLVKLDANEVVLQENGSNLQIGNQLIYYVDT